MVRTSANLFLYFQPHGLEVEPHLLQHVDRHALPQLYQPEQQVFGPHEIVVKSIRLFARQCQHLLGARREIAHPLVTHLL